MTLSFLDRRLVREISKYGRKLCMARHKSQAVHVLSAALAYLRSLAASALSKDPYDISWKDIAFVMKEMHQDIVMLANLHTDCRPPLCATYHAKHDLAFGGIPEVAVNHSTQSCHHWSLFSHCHFGRPIMPGDAP